MLEENLIIKKLLMKVVSLEKKYKQCGCTRLTIRTNSVMYVIIVTIGDNWSIV